jgi:predicted RNA-binding Zn-ribbon protein involved in translation (DUF1610 family)
MVENGVGFSLFGAAEYWRYTDIYCPNCGERSVWRTEDTCVLESERANLCLECNCLFYLSSVAVASDWPSVLRRKAIRAGGSPGAKLFLVEKQNSFESSE